MSAPAVKPALPAAGAQAPKVGSGAPSAPPNNPPPPITGGPKVLPTTGSPNRPLAPPNANHATVGAVPLSLVQEHKGSGGLNQQPPTVNRTPEKTVASAVGVKPTSNGVEGSPNRPITTSQPPAEAKKSDEGSVSAAIMNHSADVAATPPQPQASLHNPLVSGIQLSPAKSQAAPVPPSTTNHSTLVSATSKLETTAEAKPSASLGTIQSTESPPASTQQQAPTLTQQTQQQSVAPQQQQQQPPQLTPQPPQQQAPQQNQPQVPQQQQQQQQQQQPLLPQAKSAPATVPLATPQPAAPVPPQTQPSSAPSQQNPPAAPVQSQTVTPTQEPPAKLAAQTVESTKTRIEAPPKPEFKVATPPRNSKRKREVKPPTEVISAGSTKTSTSSEQDDRKSKRVRTQTQPYQSPLPELTYIAKLKTLMKSPDDKLIVFYKNEFLAVRNAEGGFYICQAMQNIYKSSPRIRIRWLSQEKKDSKITDVYIPDFYDATDFDCILTNLELKRLDKNKFQLPEEERERTQSILKRALDVEKGVSEKPPVTEEHPDGLDLSLFRDESQLKKRSLKRSTPRKKGKENASGTEDGYEGLTGDELEEEQEEEEEEEEEEEVVEVVKKKKPKHNKKVKKPKEKAKTKEKPVEKKVERVLERGRDRSLAAKRRSESTAVVAAAATAAAAAKNTVVKQTVAKHVVAKTADKKSKAVIKQTPKKPEPVVETSIPTRSTKTRSVKITPQPKSSPVTRTKERERRGTASAKGRKKPGKKA